MVGSPPLGVAAAAFGIAGGSAQSDWSRKLGLAATAADDRIRGETRIVGVLVVKVLASAFLVLYLFADRTDELFAWTIRPRATPLLMGAGYASGVYFFARTAT